MKFLFLGLIILMPAYGLHAEGFSRKCIDEMNKLCPKPEGQDACLQSNADKLSAECKITTAGQNPCSEMAMKNKCEGKRGDELIKCMSAKGVGDDIFKNMKKNGSPACKKFLEKVRRQPECPQAPDSKTNLDISGPAFDKFYDNLSPECRARLKMH